MSRTGIFFFMHTATTETYTLSLHDALPISPRCRPSPPPPCARGCTRAHGGRSEEQRLNSSHMSISYAVFCLKKKKQLLLRGALAAGDDRAGLAHSFPRRRSDADNEAHHRLF